MESFGVSGHTDGLIGMAMQADGVVVRALRRSKMPSGELGSVARGEAAALAILFKPRPRLGFLGIRLLAFFVVFAILHHLHGVRRLGVQGKVKQKVAGKSEQRDNERQRNNDGYLKLSMGGVRFETFTVLLEDVDMSTLKTSALWMFAVDA